MTLSIEQVTEERHYGYADRLGYVFCAVHARPDHTRFSVTRREDERCRQCGARLYDVPTLVTGTTVVEHVRCKIF